MAGHRILGRRGAVRVLGLAAVVVLLSTVGNSAHAVVPSPAGYSLTLSPSPRILDALDMKNDGEISASQYYDIVYDESCDNPHLRIRARNKPAIMIENYPNSAAPITSFTLTINEGPYAFGSGDAATDNFTNFVKNTMYTDSGVSITGSSLSNNNKTLTVNFSGLDAGKKAIFNIDLDTTDPNAFMYPDYRVVLFGAPLSGQSPTDPATATATFTNASSPAPNSQTLTINFEQDEETPEYYNEHIRPYHAMDMMEVVTTGVPEPTGALLALAGVVALVAHGRRNRLAA